MALSTLEEIRRGKRRGGGEQSSKAIVGND